MNQKLIKPSFVIGKNLTFRDIQVCDAEFILNLRSNPKINKYLSPISAKLADQESWLLGYKNNHNQIYFIIESNLGERIGTVRLYNESEDSFCWGSWILAANTKNNFAVESALMVYQYALELGFKTAHFDVRKGNTSVWRFHENFGATRISESDIDYYYSISHDSILKALKKYKKYTSTLEIIW